MGSLGSKVINDKMKEILPKFNNKGYEVLFITGNDYFEELIKLYYEDKPLKERFHEITPKHKLCGKRLEVKSII